MRTFRNIKWWKKILLLFCKTYMCIEKPTSVGDLGCIIKYKKLFRNFYVTNIEYTISPPDYFDCRCTELLNENFWDLL